MWVILSAGTAIALGTYLGGWRIIRTLGKGLTDLAPPQGFAAQTSAATAILASSHIGFSLSTTQVCSGAVMGSGLGRRGGVVRWSTATRMLVAWCLTLPAAGLVGAGAEVLTKQGTWGTVVTGALLLAGSGTIWVLSRRKPVTVDNVNDLDGVGDIDAAEADGGVPAESPGVVTAAIAAVAPPPAGPLVEADTAGTAGANTPVVELQATIPAPDTGSAAEPTRPAAV